MQVGHTFTIEPMINEGTDKHIEWADGWTACTRDGKRSAPLTFVVGPAFELVEPPDYEFLDHVVSAAFGPMLEAGAQLDPLPVANVLVQEQQETSVFGN